VGRPWVGRVGAYAIGLSGLAMAGFVWWVLSLNTSERPTYLNQLEWKTMAIVRPRPKVLGGCFPWKCETPGRKIADWLGAREQDRRQKAREVIDRPRMRRVARVERIQLPVETPTEPNLLAVR